MKRICSSEFFMEGLTLSLRAMVHQFSGQHLLLGVGLLAVLFLLKRGWIVTPCKTAADAHSGRDLCEFACRLLQLCCLLSLRTRQERNKPKGLCFPVGKAEKYVGPQCYPLAGPLLSYRGGFPLGTQPISTEVSHTLLRWLQYFFASHHQWDILHSPWAPRVWQAMCPWSGCCLAQGKLCAPNQNPGRGEVQKWYWRQCDFTANEVWAELKNSPQ